MIVQPHHWFVALGGSLALHLGVVAYTWSRPDAIEVQSRAGAMTIVNGGQVNSAGSDGAQAVVPAQVEPAPTAMAQPVAPDSNDPSVVAPDLSASEPAEMASAAPAAAQSGVPVRATGVAPEIAPSVVAPTRTARAPTVTAPVVTPAPVQATKPKPESKPKLRAQAAARADTAGSRTNAQRQAQQAGSGGRNTRADGRAAESSYASRVVSRLQSRKRYPAAARRTRAQGTVRVQFTINSSGRVTDARVVRGSGSRALDQAALSLVRRSSPFPRFPAAIRKNRLTYTVPLSYRMR